MGKNNGLWVILWLLVCGSFVGMCVFLSQITENQREITQAENYAEVIHENNPEHPIYFSEAYYEAKDALVQATTYMVICGVVFGMTLILMSVVSNESSLEKRIADFEAQLQEKTKN